MTEQNQMDEPTRYIFLNPTFISDDHFYVSLLTCVRLITGFHGSTEPTENDPHRVYHRAQVTL